MTNRVALSVLFLLVVGCDRTVCPREVDAGGDSPEVAGGFIVGGHWTIHGEVPSPQTCAAAGIARVRLRILDADASILDEVTVPCADGSVDGSMLLSWRDRYYGEWAALGADGGTRESVPVTRRVVAAPPTERLDLLPPDFEPRPVEWRDYRAGGTVYVTEWTGPETCSARGVDTFQIVIAAEDGSGDPVVHSVACATAGMDGSIVVRTEPLFDWNRTYRITWSALASDGSTLMTLDLGQVRMVSPARALLGLSVYATPTGIEPYI